MKYLISLLSVLATASLLSSCATTSSMNSTKLTAPEPRVITLGGDPLDEEEYGSFVTWKCTDYVNDPDTLVEVGYLQELPHIGFVLYDGGNTGDLTMYERKGLNHRWDWGGELTFDYAFIVKADGKGLFYDFSNVEAGESALSNQVFKCKRSG
ncbi:hypothetical protein AB4525_08845 [Vibrio breoganii]